MLRLSVAIEEWLKIGEDINIVFLGMSERHVRIMIDAPRDIPVSRSRAREKYLSVADYKREERIAKNHINERNGRIKEENKMNLPVWITEENRWKAVYGIYGVVRLARDCYNTILLGGTQKILAYVNPQRAKDDCNVAVQDESALKNPELDYIIVAVPDLKNYRVFENKLRNLGIPKRKIIWISKI